jgi:pimeloyl-ACP methyl ester carboxylesterase
MSIAAVAAAAQVERTPCGEGDIVWRLWGAGTPLVLLHGGSGSWMHWLRNIPVLARQYRVLAPDTPGLGESAMPPGEATPADAALALRDGLARLLGERRRYHLCGFSFGAHVGGHLAALESARVISLTLVGAASLGLARPPLDLLRVREKEGAERRAAHRENLARLMIHDPARIDDTALDIQEHNTRHARLRSRGFASGDGLKRALGRVAAPLAGIWGEFDAVAMPDIRARLDVLRAVDPGLMETVIPGAGHWVAYESPETFNAALLRVLEAREAP